MNERIGRLRERYRALDIALAVVAKGTQDGAGRLAAVVAYFSFFSLFPLLLVLVWVLDQFLSGSTRTKILNSAIGKFPVIGDDISKNVGHLGGGPWALIVGIGGALWAGTKAFESFEYAMRVVWWGAASKPDKFVKRKLRAVVMIGVFGLGLGIATAGTGVVTTLDQIPVAARPLGLLVSVALNVGLVAVMFILSTPPPHPRWREVRAGSLLAGVGLTLLYSVGTTYLTKVVKSAGNTYGVFAVVIGLLTWLNLIGTLLVWSAELNSVLNGRRAVEATRPSR